MTARDIAHRHKRLGDYIVTHQASSTGIYPMGRAFELRHFYQPHSRDWTAPIAIDERGFPLMTMAERWARDVDHFLKEAWPAEFARG